MRHIALAWSAAACLLAACDDTTRSRVEEPSSPATARTRALEGGAALLQNDGPLAAFNAYMDGFHFDNGNLKQQFEAHHYCSTLNEDVRQCVIFDGSGRDAKLMGIEYVVSRRVFEELPPEERKLWHSHVYEVKSGALVAPGLPEAAEHEFMEQMVGTYGKTWHTWHTDEDHELPTGHPMLMAGFTGDGQLDQGLLDARDQRLDVSSDDRRRAREDIAAPLIVDGADAWQRGEVLQLTLQPTVAQSNSSTREPRDDSTTEPTRPIRGTRVRQLYAALPAAHER